MHLHCSVLPGGVEVAAKFASAVGIRKPARGNKRKIEDEEKVEEKQKKKDKSPYIRIWAIAWNKGTASSPDLNCLVEILITGVVVVVCLLSVSGMS